MASKKIRLVINFALAISLIVAASRIGLNLDLILEFLNTLGPYRAVLLFVVGLIGMFTFSLVTARVFFRYLDQDMPLLLMLFKTLITQIGKYFPIGPLSVLAQGETFRGEKGGRKQSYASVAYVTLSQIAAGGLIASLLLFETPSLAIPLGIASLFFLATTFLSMIYLDKFSMSSSTNLQRFFVLLRDLALLFIAWILVGSVTSVMIISSGSNEKFSALLAVSVIAWLAGILAFIAPAGLGVREAIFLLVLSESDKTALTTALVVSRTYFIFIDVFLAVIGFYYLRKKNEQKT